MQTSNLRKSLKRIIYKFDILFRFYYRYFYNPPQNTIQYFIDVLSRSREIFFIQIGANDGIFNDPIYKFIRRDKWKGILIEPQKEIFDRLVKNYQWNKNLIFENVAVSDKCGEIPLYKISFTNADWASGISSLKKEAVENNIKSGYIARKARESGVTLPPVMQEYICSESVRCITFDQLVDKYHLKKIDLLVIDTEDYDYEIIKSIDFNNIEIRNIMYEHAGLKENDKISCESLLKNLGYKIFTDQADTLAFY